ncbi:MAG: deoxyribodipyrimidine photo-lyase [Desulfococcaceae bacterium]
MKIEQTRIQHLNRKEIQPGHYVLYWMQQSQRAECNHALEYAVLQANELKIPVLTVFGLSAQYPEANLRHYTFMTEGLRETREELVRQGIRMIIRRAQPDEAALEAGKNAALIVCDRGYLRHQKQWRRNVAEKAVCRVVQAESDVIIPVETVSPKAEYAARTIRPKIRRHLDTYLTGFRRSLPHISSTETDWGIPDIGDSDDWLRDLNIDRSVLPVSCFYTGGTSHAEALFEEFLTQKLSNYDQHHNRPEKGDVSCMSPYLHFGQISPLWLALRIKTLENKYPEAVSAWLEQIIVRRELAMNFVYYTDNYDRYDCLPVWARTTLDQHRDDFREYLYKAEELEKARTHDEYWNAAMSEMIHTGYMHNHMRMYWGKKILEWSRSPEQAFETLLYLNNRYFLDGRDPNSYEGVAWIFGLHDRAWQARPVFGKIRCMTASGLERKCDIGDYVRKITRLSGKK